jgi:hypothetical protein
MKKLLLSIAAASVMLVACKKEESGITQTNQIVNAVIKGKAYANTDLTNVDAEWGWDIYENVPDGTVVIALVEHDGQTFRYQTTVTNGEYSFEIPARNEGVSVTIEYSDFRSNVKFGPNAADVYPNVVFSRGDDGVWVYPGVTEVMDTEWEMNN